jgi:hypothetical protein
VLVQDGHLAAASCDTTQQEVAPGVMRLSTLQRLLRGNTTLRGLTLKGKCH